MITHVAIKRGNNVYSLPRPYRHHHVLHAMIRARADQDEETEVQGFIADGDVFLTREEAYKTVVGTPQFKRKPGGYDGPELFSEDLW